MYTVALLENDEWILKGIKRTFPWERYGFTVSGFFSDPLELLESLEETLVDVVFTDIKMPNMSGLELIEHLKADPRFSHILFIIISAYDNYDFMRKAINLGVVDYCRKPIQRDIADKILQTLKTRLDERSDIPSAPEPNPIEIESITHKGFQEILAYIQKHYNRKLTLNEIVEQFHYNANYICLLFRNHMHMSFSEYLLVVRMEKAKELFDTKKYSIKEVQNLVGYGEYSYFHSNFTKYFGITPAKYLKGDNAGKSE